jgi:hypothetical protein
MAAQFVNVGVGYQEHGDVGRRRTAWFSDAGIAG